MRLKQRCYDSHCFLSTVGSLKPQPESYSWTLSMAKGAMDIVQSLPTIFIGQSPLPEQVHAEQPGMEVLGATQPIPHCLVANHHPCLWRSNFILRFLFDQSGDRWCWVGPRWLPSLRPTSRQACLRSHQACAQPCTINPPLFFSIHLLPISLHEK